MSAPDSRPDASPRPRPAVLAGLFALTAVCSVLPWWLAERGVAAAADYPLWGFSPVLPLCLYGAAFLRSRAAAVLLPVGAWVFQGFVQAAWWGDWAAGFSPVIGWVYAALAASAALGLRLRGDRGAVAVAGLGLESAVLFFLVTNFGSWLGNSAYPQTPGGLAAALTAGVPFFRGTLLSQAVFLPLLFAAPAFLPRPARRAAEEPALVSAA